MTFIPQEFVSRYKNIRHFVTSVKEIIRHGYPARKLKIIGVTGTDGKTTTSHLIYEILRTARKRTALISTIGVFLDSEVIDTGFHVTTPDAIILQPLFKKMANKGIEYLVLEASSHGLDQHRVLGSNFLVGVLTNVTPEHLDYHKSFERYKKAKQKLFRGVKFAVLNKDDPSFDDFAHAARKNTRIISYSLKEDAVLRADAIKEASGGMSFNTKENNRIFKIKTSLLGRYNILNILAAIGAARSLSIDWKNIEKAIREFKGAEGRMEEIVLGQSFRVIVDFAHTPNGLRNLLKTLSKAKQRNNRLITVIGSAGERDPGKRPLLGEVATHFSDVVIFTAEDPRREDVNTIIKQMVEGARKTSSVMVEPDRAKAIELAISIARKGDIVAICGKGHEKSMSIGGQEIPWSDQETAKEVLSNNYDFKEH